MVNPETVHAHKQNTPHLFTPEPVLQQFTPSNEHQTTLFNAFAGHFAAGDSLFALGSFGEAESCYNKALAKAVSLNQKGLMVITYNRLGFVLYWLNHFQQSLRNYQNTITLCKQSIEADSLALFEAQVFRKHILSYQLDSTPKGDWEKIAVPSGIYQDPKQLRKYNYLLCLYHLNNEDPIALAQSIEKNIQLSTTYSDEKIWQFLLKDQKACYYSNVNDYSISIKYYENLYFQTEEFPELSPFKLRIIRHLVMDYLSIGRYSDALQLAGPYKDLIQGKKAPFYYIDYIRLAEVYASTNQPGLAKYHFQNAISLLKNNTVIDKRLARAYCYLGYFYNESAHQPDSMLVYLTKAELIVRDYPDQYLEHFIANYLGYYYYTRQEYELSIFYTNLIIDDLDRLLNNDDYFVTQHLKLLRTNYLAALKIRASAFHHLSIRKNNDPTSLESAYSDYQKLLQLKKKFYGLQDYQASRITRLQDMRTSYNDLIDLGFSRYDLHPERQKLDELFRIMEESKSYMLKNYISSEEAKNMAGVPEELIQQSRLLQKEIDTLQFAVNQQDYYAIHYSNNLLIDQLLAKIEVRKKFEDQLAQNFPKIAQFRNQLTAIPTKITNIQNRLNTNQGLVEFMYTSHSLYTFYIDQDTAFILRNTISPNFPDTILQLSEYFSEFSFDAFTKTGVQKYLFDTYALYQKTLAPLEPFMEGKRLFLIPDKELCLVPFEALVYDTTGSLAQIGYSNLPYLVKKHSISYLFSSDQITRSSIRIKQRTTFAGFAPEYILTKDNPSYAPLPGAREEILSAQKYYSSRMYVTPSIDKADFFKACRKKDIVHLAMHTELDVERPMNSRFIIQPQHSDQDQLHAYEIYAQENNTTLMILSACNTGQGKLIHGEGIFNISRAFLLAGVPNIIFTQWSVADNSSQLLMQFFYHNLAHGKSTDLALQEAKKNYLRTTDPVKSHPYYWAGYTLMGNPVSLPSIRYRNMALAGGVLLALFFLLSRFITKRKSAAKKE